ncbi:MAG: response regulator [Cyanobacteria bacterium P01_F01_bin.150]
MPEDSSCPNQILIVDDDREIRDLLSQFLQKHGYHAHTAGNGQEMHHQLAQVNYDLIVLDLMLPGDDGLTLCRQLRSHSTIPIIMLTAVGEDMDRIIGLEMGADDYVTKPFNPRELLARIKAVLRRHDYAQAPSPNSSINSANPSANVPTNTPISADKLAPAPCFQFGPWILDLGKRELRHQTNVPDRPSPSSTPSASLAASSGTLVSLTAGEFDLLLAFVEHPQRVLSRDQLLDYTKGHAAMNFDRSVDVQLSRLRRKIETDPKDPQLIKTIRGGGYLFTPLVTRY